MASNHFDDQDDDSGGFVRTRRSNRPPRGGQRNRNDRDRNRRGRGQQPNDDYDGERPFSESPSSFKDGQGETEMSTEARTTTPSETPDVVSPAQELINKGGIGGNVPRQEQSGGEKTSPRREFLACPTCGNQRFNNRDGSAHVICKACYSKVQTENQGSAVERAYSRAKGETVMEMSALEWALRNVNIENIEQELASANSAHPDASDKREEIHDEKSDKVRELLSEMTGGKFVSNKREYLTLLRIAVGVGLGEKELSREELANEMDELSTRCPSDKDAERRLWMRVSAFASRESGFTAVRKLAGQLKAAKKLLENNAEFLDSLQSPVEEEVTEPSSAPQDSSETLESMDPDNMTLPQLKGAADGLGLKVTSSARTGKGGRTPRPVMADYVVALKAEIARAAAAVTA